jgi:hypothetical protein
VAARGQHGEAGLRQRAAGGERPDVARRAALDEATFLFFLSWLLIWVGCWKGEVFGSVTLRCATPYHRMPLVFVVKHTDLILKGKEKEES